MSEVVVVCGRQNSGKTTWIVHLVAALRERGFRVGTIKHTHHDYAVVGKDTTRHQRAGAERVLLASPTGCATYETWNDEPDLHELVDRHFLGFDVVFAEGYRSLAGPKFVVGDDPEANPRGLLRQLEPIRGQPNQDSLMAAVNLMEQLILNQRSVS